MRPKFAVAALCVAIGIVASAILWSWRESRQEEAEALRKRQNALMSLERHSEHLQDLARIRAGGGLPSEEEKNQREILRQLKLSNGAYH